jgi:hypothetical protein
LQQQQQQSDRWKLGLLDVLVADHYLSSAQARRVVAGFQYGQDQVQAAVQVSVAAAARSCLAAGVA